MQSRRVRIFGAVRHGWAVFPAMHSHLCEIWKNAFAVHISIRGIHHLSKFITDRKHVFHKAAMKGSAVSEVQQKVWSNTYLHRMCKPRAHHQFSYETQVPEDILRQLPRKSIDFGVKFLFVYSQINFRGYIRGSILTISCKLAYILNS